MYAGKHVSPYTHTCECVCVRVCVQVGICALWHVCPQHGATAGPVPASWRLNLLRGSAAQWWEVGRTHNDAPTICPGLPSDRDVQLGRPSQGLTAPHSPIHKTQGGGGGGGRLERYKRGGGDRRGCGGGGNFEKGGGNCSQQGSQNSSRAKSRHTANSSTDRRRREE